MQWTALRWAGGEGDCGGLCAPASAAGLSGGRPPPPSPHKLPLQAPPMLQRSPLPLLSLPCPAVSWLPQVALPLSLPAHLLLAARRAAPAPLAAPVSAFLCALNL